MGVLKFVYLFGMILDECMGDRFIVDYKKKKGYLELNFNNVIMEGNFYVIVLNVYWFEREF